MAPSLSPPRQWQVALLGAHADIAAKPFECAWGGARVGEPRGEDGRPADLTILLDPEIDPAPGSGMVIAWHPMATSTGAGRPAIARPWPVADDLFSLAPSARDDTCLVIAPDAAEAQAIVDRLAERRLQVEVSAVATRELLARARIVVSLGPGLPPETFAVLASGRLLVSPATGPRFGLQPWIDHVTFSTEDELVQIVDALAAFPASWVPLQAFGRQSAAPHLARHAIGRVVRRLQAEA